MKLLKRIFIVLFIVLASCQGPQRIDSVQKVVLSEFEETLLQMHSDYYYVFALKSGCSYNFKIRCYKNGVEQDIAGEINNIDASNKDIQIIISGKKETGGNIAWTVSCDNNMHAFPTANTYAVSGNYNSCNDSIDTLTMEEEREYALACVILDQDSSFAVSTTNAILHLDAFEKECYLLNDFACVYIVTIENV